MKNLHEKYLRKLFSPILHCVVSLIVINSYSISAAPYTPTSPDTVISTTQVKPDSTDNPEKILPYLESLIIKADKPGNSYLYGVAQSTVDSFLTDNDSSDKAWLIKAKIQQYRHEFNDAIVSLKKSLAITPNNESALLMLSRINIIQKNYNEAKRNCTRLFGVTDPMTINICLLEVDSYQNSLTESYKKLTQLVKTSNITSPTYQNWAGLLLADMSTRMDKLEQSEYWLDYYFNPNNISFIIAWAETKIKLGKHKKVYETLSQIANKVNYIEDPILLNLAIAEKYKQTAETQWRDKLSQRIKLREQREDIIHASDIATYYIDIQLNPEKALKWAQINWQQTKGLRDKALLEKAQAISGETS
jgi:tetratricopeptide (TPR) repeat protein